MRTETINKVLRFLLDHLRFATIVLAAVFALSLVLLLLNQKDAEALYRQAREQISLNDPQSALELLQQIEREYPRYWRMEDVLFEQGNIHYFHNNDIFEALNRWNRVLAINSDSRHALVIHTRMAEIYQNVVGDLPNAIKHYRLIITRFPNDPNNHQNRLQLANCYIRSDQFEAAIIELKSLRGATPNPPLRHQATIQLAMIYILRKQYPPARELLEPIVAAPHCARCRHLALMNLSDILEIQEDYEKAIEILGQIPDNVLSDDQKQTRISNIRKKIVSPGPSGP